MLVGVVACCRRELKFLHSIPVQSSEQQELQRIAELRRALADKRRLAEESRVKALAVPSAAVRPSSQQLTEPEGFHFATDERLKTHGMETRQDVKQMCFTAELRHYDLHTVCHCDFMPRPLCVAVMLAMPCPRFVTYSIVHTSHVIMYAAKYLKSGP